MKTLQRSVLGGTLFSLLVAGCGNPVGGGATTVNQREAAFGIGKSGVAFVIFTDVSATGTETRSGGRSGLFRSQQTGAIVPASGPRIDYVGDSGFLTVGGRKFELADGRVFLIATHTGSLEVQQLEVQVQPTELSTDAFRAEIRRLAEDDQIRPFMSNPGEGGW